MKKSLPILIILIAFATTTNAQWQLLNSTTTDTLNDVFFIDADNGFVLGGNFHSTPVVNTLLETTDGGSNWDIQNPAPLSIFFTDLNNGYWSGLDTIYSTTDAGAHVTAYPLGLGSFAVVFNIYFYNATVGYAAIYDLASQNDYMAYTTNAGISWATVSGGSNATPGEKNIFCTSENTCYVVGNSGNSGNNGIIKTTDGGATWTNIYDPSNMDCHSVFFSSADNGVVVGGGNGNGSSSGILHTTDGGDTWTEVSYSGNGERLTSVGFTDATNGVAVGYGGTILQTSDGGASWNPMTSPTTNDLHSLHFPTATTGYAVGKTGTIIKYTGPLTGIEGNDPSVAMDVYPNPVGQNLTVNFPTNEDCQISLEIFNMLGQQVFIQKNYTQKRITLDVSQFVEGVYFVHATTEKGTVSIKKIVIQK